MLSYDRNPGISNKFELTQLLKITNSEKIETSRIPVSYSVEILLFGPEENKTRFKERTLLVGFNGREANITENFLTKTIQSYQGIKLPRELFDCIYEKMPRKSIRNFLEKINEAGYVEE